MRQWTWWCGTAAPVTPSSFQVAFTTLLGHGLLALSGSMLLRRPTKCGRSVGRRRVPRPPASVPLVPGVNRASGIRRRS